LTKKILMGICYSCHLWAALCPGLNGLYCLELYPPNCRVCTSFRSG